MWKIAYTLLTLTLNSFFNQLSPTGDGVLCVYSILSWPRTNFQLCSPVQLDIPVSSPTRLLKPIYCLYSSELFCKQRARLADHTFIWIKLNGMFIQHGASSSSSATTPTKTVWDVLIFLDKLVWNIFTTKCHHFKKCH